MIPSLWRQTPWGKANVWVAQGVSNNMFSVAGDADIKVSWTIKVLRNDPATGVMRHADAGYEIAINCAVEAKLDLPMIDATGKGVK